MHTSKSYYFNSYICLYKLLPLFIGGFLFACSGQNETKQILSTENQIPVSEAAINVNTASASELGKLPGIGEQTAREIIEHRARFGRFRKPEHLILVRGISDARFRELRNLVKVE